MIEALPAGSVLADTAYSTRCLDPVEIGSWSENVATRLLSAKEAKVQGIIHRIMAVAQILTQAAGRPFLEF